MTSTIAAVRAADPASQCHDWWYLGIDETRHWNLREAWRPFIKRILTVYGFDRQSHTYCCELRPSHWLVCCGFSLEFNEDAPGFTDQLREEIDSAIWGVPFQESDGYFHVSYIDDLLVQAEALVPRYHRGLEPKVEDHEFSTEAADFWVSNPRF